MNLDTAWISVISGFAGGAAVWAGRMITDWVSHRRDEERRVREEGQRLRASCDIAYYKFIEVFSTPMVGDDTLNYLQASIGALVDGNIVFSKSFKSKSDLFDFEIASLDDLLYVLICMRSSHISGGSEQSLATYKSDFEELRKGVLDLGLDVFINGLRQSEYFQADKAKEVPKRV